MARIIFQLSFFFFSFWCIKANSQPVNNLFGDVVMPSPNASALGKYTDAPVDLSSGIPQISVPIYNLTQGPLSLPISLDYHASGCKVAETPTWVGTGWALKAGGMVARTVLGMPDEFDAGFYYTGQNLNVAPNLPISELLSNSIVNNTTDGEPDLFFFSFPGYSGYFYIDYLHQPTLIPHQDLVIKFNGNNTLGSSPQTDRFQNFTVITPDGNNYIFGSVPGISENGFESIENTNFGTSKYRSGWYLMRIETSDGLHKIDFSYEEEKFTYVSQGVSGKDFVDFTANVCCLPEQPQAYQLDYFINLTSKRLKWIQTTQEKISFEATTDREDTGVPLGSTIKAKRLDRIKIETFVSPIWCKRFDLDFDYFKVSPTSSNFWEKHLRLLSIQEITCDGLSSKPKELFQYEGDFLPSTLSRAYDHWGYYNAAGAGVPPTTLDPDGSGPIPPVTFGSGSRESNETEMKKGILKKVIYPTGGAVSYTYEANDYKLCTIGAPVSLFSFTAPSCHAFDVTSNTISFNSNSLSSLTYKITHTPPSTCGSGVQLNYNYTLQIWNQSNNTLINTYQFNSATNVVLQGDLLTLFPQIQANNIYYFKILTASSEQTFTIYQPCTDIKVGGLRVKEVRINDGINSQNDIVKSYSYKGSDGFSSGSLYKIPVYGIILNGLIDLLGQDCYNTSFSVIVFMRKWTSIPFLPISSFSGRHITYSKVKESSGNNGYIEYEYISTEVTPQPNTSFPSIPETIALNLGKQTKNTVVTANGLTLGVNNTTFNATYLQGNDYFLRVSPVTFSYTCGGVFDTQTKYANALFSNYTGYSLLTQKESILDGVSTITTYTYNNDPINFQLAPESEQMTNSDGLISKVEYKYNYTLNDALTRQFLINRNIISQPWGVRKWVSNILVDGSDNEYAFYNLTTGAYQTSSTGGFARLYKQYRYETTWDANGVIIGPNTILKATINSYDSKGFPTSYQAANWLPITYEWNTVGTLKKKTYKDFVWEYTYHPGTQFLSYVKNIDGQETWYDYDEFWRLKKISSRPTTIGNKSSANVYSEFNYQYININNLKNYTKTKITYTPIAGSNIISQESFEYLDGLGRHLQTVGKQQSPNQKDVVTEATEYDPNGRISKVYIPYEVTTGTTGAFTAIPNGTFFSKNIYEPSPLNRLSLVTPPDWYPTQVLYGANAVNEVLVPGTSTYFTPNSLFKTTTILPDPTCSKTGFPNGNRKISFKDKKGRVVLERETNASGTLVADTYTKYDNKDREILVIPPGASAADADLVFKYTYDGEDKTLTKKVPDLGLMTFKYNDRDQLVFEQDGNLAQTSNWQCSRYDDYGRLLKSGLFTGTIPNPIPLSLDPTDNYIENTYDGTLPIQKGKLIKNRTRVFDAGNTWLESNYSFDNYGRVNLISGNNYLLPNDFNAESTTFSYDFADNILQDIKTSKKNTTTSYLITQNHLFDHWGRNTINKHKVGSGPEHILNQLNYSFKDELIERNIGKAPAFTEYLQSVDYSYNPQSWLQSINSSSLGGTNTNITTCPTPSNIPNPGAASTSPDLNDLFYLDLKYDQLQTGITGTVQKSGNISQVIWRVRGRERQSYSSNYDFLDRISTSTYQDINDLGTATSNSSAWNESLTYDLRSNILSVNRTGKYKVTPGASCWTDGVIDNLTFTLNPGSNRTQKVADAAPTASKSFGWNNAANAPSTAQYSYDANGNLVADPYKGINSITYNYLNSPKRVTFAGKKVIDFIYDASGRKIRKVVTDNGILVKQQDYWDGMEYQSTSTNSLSLESIYHQEGRVFNTNVGTSNSDALRYEYWISDHLGNTRLSFTDKNNDGKIDVNNLSSNEVLQESNYYPFGLSMDGPWINDAALDNKYLYTCKEFNDDFGLNWYDYDQRWYDPSICKWQGIDPMAENYKFATPYNYALNNPFRNSDPDGSMVLTDIYLNTNNEVIKTIYDGDSRNHYFRGEYDGDKLNVYDDLGFDYGEKMHALDGVTNWLQRATIATQNNPSSHDVSGLYAFADQAPNYLTGTVNALFLGESLIGASASLWRFGMRKLAERGSQVAAKGVTPFTTQFTKSSLQLGQQMHKMYKAGLADKVNTFKEFVLPSGKRIDFLDIKKGIIYELKPNNPRAILQGQKQLQMYMQELQGMPKYQGIQWKTVLDTY